jgi:hypothetical protein
MLYAHIASNSTYHFEEDIVKNISRHLFFATLFVGVASSASAATTNPCDVWSWQLTGAIPVQYYAGSIPNLPSAIPSTSCVGVNQGNDDPFNNPHPNLGYANDGLLNGEGGLLSPTQFINASQLQDIKKDGTANDPGWIMLGSLGGNSGELSYNSVTTQLGTFNLADFVTYTQTYLNEVEGTWELIVDKDLVSKLTAIGLDRSAFDHLAISVKASQYWAVYDFDFNLIPGFDLTQPYSLKGTWTTNYDFYNEKNKGQDISHMAVWVRDPIPEHNVPAPATLFLIGAGLLALRMTAKSNVKS